MTYDFPAIYTAIRNAVLIAYPEAECTSRFAVKLAHFPTVYVHPVDRYRVKQNVQLDGEDNQYRMTIEVKVACNSATAMSDSYAIMETVREEMKKIFFIETSETAIESTTKYEVVGRFARMIGGGDTMPDSTE